MSYGYPGLEELPPAPGQGTPFGPIPATILDPFSGVATTGIYALRYNCNYIGIDISQEYNDIAAARLDKDIVERVTQRKLAEEKATLLARGAIKLNNNGDVQLTLLDSP